MEREIRLHQLDTLPMPGDVALVRGRGVGSQVLIWLQKLLGRDGDFSHILFCIGADLWCQAMPGKGVHVVTTADAFLSEKGRPETVEILRPPASVTKLMTSPPSGRNDAVPDRIVDALGGAIFMSEEWSAWLRVTMYFVGQNYNYLVLLGKWYLDRSKFCSELVAGAMAAREFSPFVGQRHTSFAPNDLRWENLRDHAWTKFTPQFERYLASAILPSPSEQAEQEARTVQSFVGLTDSTTALIETFAWSIQRQIKTIQVSRSFSEGAFLEPDLVNNLKERMTQAHQCLDQLHEIGAMQRGAPWIGGKNSYKRRATAERALRAAVVESKAFLETCPQKDR